TRKKACARPLSRLLTNSRTRRILEEESPMKASVWAVPILAMLVLDLRADESQLTTIPDKQTARHGTAVEFVGTPVEAAKLAAREKKLVFVVHVAGYFEDPEFT